MTLVLYSEIECKTDALALNTSRELAASIWLKEEHENERDVFSKYCFLKACFWEWGQAEDKIM